MESPDEHPSLTCDTPGYEAGWLHLAPQVGSSLTKDLTYITSWVMTFGYPLMEEPLEACAQFGISLPDETKLSAWVSGLYICLWLPPDTVIPDLAALLVDVTEQIQGIPQESVEIALQYE